VTWLLHTWHGSLTCDVTRSYVTWLVFMWRGSWTFVVFQRWVSDFDQLSPRIGGICTWHDSIIYDVKNSYVAWLMHMRHDSLRNGFRTLDSCHGWNPTVIRGMTHSHVMWLVRMWRDSCLCDMTHSTIGFGLWSAVTDDMGHWCMAWLI